MVAHEIRLDRVDLDALDEFLISERSPPDSMMLSDLDGFLTGIVIGPEMIGPSEWLPLVWGGGAPAFADMDEASTVLGSILGRYNEILRQIADETPGPVFWTDPDGVVNAEDWAEGFLQAVHLRMHAWRPLLKSKRHVELLVPILALCGDEDGESLLGLTAEAEDLFGDHAPELIPAAIVAIAEYWRGKRPKQTATPVNSRRAPRPGRGSPKASRNDPCPCGSGKKFKSCCGKTA